MNYLNDGDDDSQNLPPQNPRAYLQKPLKPLNNTHRPSKKPKQSSNPGKENLGPVLESNGNMGSDEICSLDAIPSSIDCVSCVAYDEQRLEDNVNGNSVCWSAGDEKKVSLKMNSGYMSNSIESRLIRSRVDCRFDLSNGGSGEDLPEEFEEQEDTELDVLLKLCSRMEEEDKVTGSRVNQEEAYGLQFENGSSVQCPLCGTDISDLSEEQRHVHTNDCLDREEIQTQDVTRPCDDRGPQFQPQAVHGSVQTPQLADDVSPVLQWLRSLGLEKYEEPFVQEEIDWDTLQWLTEEDLFSMGVTALGPRKKIVHALSELKKGCSDAVETRTGSHATNTELFKTSSSGAHTESFNVVTEEIVKPSANKLITDYFLGSINEKKKVCANDRRQPTSEKSHSRSGRKCSMVKNQAKSVKMRDIPPWCSIPGTPFRVDAFRYLRGDCSHWFLTHFHMDHYQGLTRSFCHGKIYCSSITARLVNMKIGIPWEKLQVLPLNQKINIAGIDVTCMDANHCPGSMIILFEPPNGKAVLHTGDFRYSEEMASMPLFLTRSIHTLILDTTYCSPQYDFPKQEAVIQFVIEAIQAEAFNTKTLFLIGSYTIGKERLFLEVARVLRRKVYVNAAKFRLLECLGFSEQDMQWFTLNEQESHIHVVPLWTLASFKRLKHISNQYVGRFSLIVAFSPTGWTFGKGKKKCPGRRWQQGTIIRYEVPYSEHCSFSELREFVKLVSPVNIIPSVNNDGPESASSMVSLLLS